MKHCLSIRTACFLLIAGTLTACSPGSPPTEILEVNAKNCADLALIKSIQDTPTREEFVSKCIRRPRGSQKTPDQNWVIPKPDKQ